MFARRRNKPTIISLLDRTENYPITSSGERHNILHTARLHNIVINSNLAVPRNGTSRVPSPTKLNLQQFLSMGESCSPLQIFGQVSAAAKSLRSVLYFILCLQFTLVCFANSSLLTPHSSLLIPHSSLLTPHLNSPLIFPVICSIINEIVHNNRKILTERIFIKWK